MTEYNSAEGKEKKLICVNIEEMKLDFTSTSILGL